jgi:hypothetical protein
MKTKLIIILMSALVCSFGFGQATTQQTTTTVVKETERPAVERAGTMGTVASFIPGDSITINQDMLTNPKKYPMAKGVVFDKPSGAAVSPDSVKPGTRVGVRLDAEGRVDHITLLDPR